MTEFHIIPDKWKVFSGSALKVIAVLSMFIDHVGCHLVDKKWFFYNWDLTSFCSTD